MKILNWVGFIAQAVKAENKFAVFVSNQLNLEETKDQEIWIKIVDRIKELYGFETPDYFNILAYLVDEHSLFLFETQKQQLKFFNIFNTKPIYASSIYACCFSPDGKITDENT